MRSPSSNGFGWNDEFRGIIAENELFDNWVKGFSIDNGNNLEIPMMYGHRLDMSPDDIMGTRPGLSSEGKNASSRSKRKRGRLDG
ncbi:RING-H2 finger protein ATL66 [Cucumis melo var. makuwa]|uniref:RING-H2 finger protein ATL66 n=1 Tax=Cucumis melo var. makuwa TaxID=1194695 RepID=A0A5A7T7Q3_CUCMM|nr:RING-H2 finger protein ATL66 [Cucumis melo var. makuwa]TYK30645.1 RING-H2 finger protein ATL66 [Cucumis melo var. makuwa]